MKSNLTRRQMMAITSKAVLAGSLFPTISPARDGVFSNQIGAVVGEPVAAKVGEQFLADGANAIDAAVATALAATITSPGKCGVGGYGGHAIIGLANGKVTAIDFNSTAPAAAHEDMFPLDANGNVKGKINVFGWLAAAVPGTLAGLELALNRYGTRSFREVVGPAIQLCEEGVHIRKESVQQAALDASKNNAAPKSPQTTTDPKQQNLPLAKLLRTLAERNSTDSFYRGF
jgi:gamma-glutamyltranspeptidase / glutathione hydrolase